MAEKRADAAEKRAATAEAALVAAEAAAVLQEETYRVLHRAHAYEKEMIRQDLDAATEKLSLLSAEESLGEDLERGRTTATGEPPAGSSAPRARLPVPMTPPSPHPPADVATYAQREPAEAARAMSGGDLLKALPLELQLHIANAVGERCDRAALALASPRVLGLAACRELPSYQGLEMSLAFHHVLGGMIDKQLLRSYASRSEATPEGCEWLAGVDAAAGVLVVLDETSVQLSLSAQLWYLARPGSTVGALQRRKIPRGWVQHLEGEPGLLAEILVRCELPSSGQVNHFKGERYAEHIVRKTSCGGEFVQHFEGNTLGAERMVREEQTSGDVGHFEGEKGAERVVRIVENNGDVGHFEGEKGAERLVRRETTYGGLLHYQGERGAEQPMRYELPYGGVIHLGGSTDAGRPMRETDADRVMRIYG